MILSLEFLFEYVRKNNSSVNLFLDLGDSLSESPINESGAFNDIINRKYTRDIIVEINRIRHFISEYDLNDKDSCIIINILIHFTETRILFISDIINSITKRFITSNYTVELMCDNLISKFIHYFNKSKPSNNSIIINGIDLISLSFDPSLFLSKIDPLEILNEKNNYQLNTKLNYFIEQHGYEYINSTVDISNISIFEEVYLNHFIERDCNFISDILISRYVIPSIKVFIYKYSILDNDFITTFSSKSEYYDDDSEREIVSKGRSGHSYLFHIYDVNEQLYNSSDIVSLPDYIYLIVHSSSFITNYIIQYMNKAYSSGKESFDINYLDVDYEELQPSIFELEKNPLSILRHGITFKDRSDLSNHKSCFSPNFIKDLELILTNVIITKLYNIITTNFSRLRIQEIENSINSEDINKKYEGFKDLHLCSTIVDHLTKSIN